MKFVDDQTMQDNILLESFSSGAMYSSTGSTYEGSPWDQTKVSTSMTNDVIYLRPIPEYTEQQNPTHLYFGRDVEKLGSIEALSKVINQLPRKIVVCTSWSEISSHLSPDVESICFHVSELEYGSAENIVSMVSTISKLMNIGHEITVTVGIAKDTKYSTVKALLPTGIFGIVPVFYDFGIEETQKALNAQWAHIPYWPKHIIDQLPGATKPKKVNGEIKLTPRQEQIFSIVSTKGASNKTIAKMLNITESTVKLHMGQILKKFNVKNRTQLVAFNKHEV